MLGSEARSLNALTRLWSKGSGAASVALAQSLRFNGSRTCLNWSGYASETGITASLASSVARQNANGVGDWPAVTYAFTAMPLFERQINASLPLSDSPSVFTGEQGGATIVGDLRHTNNFG